MLPGRASAIAAARDHLAHGRAVVITGAAGSGRTSVLAAVGEAFPAVCRSAGLALLAHRAAVPLAMALRAPLPEGPPEPAALADWVVERLGPAVLVVDDADLADPVTAAVLPALVGRVPLACGVSTMGSQVLLDGLEDAGANVVELGPLDDEAASRVLGDVDAGDVARVMRAAGGNPRLLVDLRDGRAPSRRSQRLLRAMADGLSAGERRAVTALALAGGAVPVSVAGALGIGPNAAWWSADAREVRVRPGLLGDLVVDEADDDARRALHAWLADAFASEGHLVEAARHHLGAGVATACRRLALRAAAVADEPRERATALDLAAGCSASDDPLLLDAAEALLAAGLGATPHLDRSTSNDPRVPVLVARDHRLGGDHDAAAVALEAADGTRPDARREAALLAVWPGWHPDRTAGALGAALGGWPRPAADVVADLAREASGDDEDALHRRLLTVVVLALDGRDVEADATVVALEDWCHTQDGARWRDAGAIAARLLRFHRDASEATMAELARLAGPGRGTGPDHAVLALADLGRTSDALRSLGPPPTLRTGEAAIRHWVAAEVNLVAGRLVAARQLARQSRDAGGPDHPVAGLATVTSAWAAVDGGEVPDDEAPTGVLAVDRAATQELEAIRLRAARGAMGGAMAFADAAEQWRRLSVRARLRCAWAAADGAGDVEGLRVVEEEARRRGLLPIAGRARQSLRRLGIRARAGRAVADGGLSAREREVLALVADGVPSREIAQRLGVGRSTVETQIASAMGKLGARTRLHAVALLAERDAP